MRVAARLKALRQWQAGCDGNISRRLLVPFGRPQAAGNRITGIIDNSKNSMLSYVSYVKAP
jgi:hypothetical protein